MKRNLTVKEIEYRARHLKTLEELNTHAAKADKSA
jgi:hypothetical protein